MRLSDRSYSLPYGFDARVSAPCNRLEMRNRAHASNAPVFPWASTSFHASNLKALPFDFVYICMRVRRNPVKGLGGGTGNARSGKMNY